MMLEYIIAHCRKYGYSDAYRDFWTFHPYCECCGNWSSAPHHIRSRASYGDDSPLNLLALCQAHHTEIHQIGVAEFVMRYPQTTSKIENALDRSRAM
jgi:hypothetical protein